MRKRARAQKSAHNPLWLQTGAKLMAFILSAIMSASLAIAMNVPIHSLTQRNRKLLSLMRHVSQFGLFCGDVAPNKIPDITIQMSSNTITIFTCSVVHTARHKFLFKNRSIFKLIVKNNIF